MESPLADVIPLTKSQHPDLGFPEGRLHQTERAGIAEISNISQKMSMFFKIQNLKIEMLEYAWEHFPHIPQSGSQEHQNFTKNTSHVYTKC